MRKRKILIVDFDEESARYLSEFLKSENYSVSSATDGETGLEKCKQEMPDLVIVEPMISKLHGFELCSIITHDFNGKIPVVILTKFYREEQFKIEATRSYGASAFLSKPFKGPEILNTIKNLLKEETNRDEAKEMAEDTQELDSILVDELITVKSTPPSSPLSFSVKSFEQEILKSLPIQPNESLKKAENTDVKSKIDKMLEDTISEFGLNIGRKERVVPRAHTELRDEASISMEALIGEKSKAPSRGEKPEIPEIEIKKPETKNAEPALTEETLKKEDKARSITQETLPGTAERAIFSEEHEDKNKPALFERLISFLGFIKKIPLKFIIPSVLVAAIAVSASFYFRKPGQPQPKSAETPGLQAMATQDPSSFDKTVSGNATEEKNSDAAPTVTKNDTPLENKGGESREGIVKTRVSEVFQVEKPEVQKVHEVNLIDHTKDIVAADTGDEIVEPLLPETEPLKALAQGSESRPKPEGEKNSLTSLIEEQSEPTKIEDAEKSANEGSQTMAGDLVPLNEVDIPPVIATRIEPEYPVFALQRGVGGQVVINVLISENGDVIETAVIRGIKGPYGFNEECEKAVRQWKFVPAFKDGMKVKVWKTISFNFKKS